ncbi:metal-sulfur cluster assembly factor [uncultured Limosilactobacillus sp.]|uniref:metal-sulfur cluster assembly factor n=1 Tax=uncultured Limosilactobacillus sp. TaxID=2837629 RepID=UPI0025D8D154|nr:metal-sulfur cluster assembly factor [uncultured Limosilactobacillus sp.]
MANPTSESIQDRMIKALQTVIDPELGIDLVNLGLIYNVELDDNGKATIQMALTTMGCPISEVLQQMIKSALMKVEEVTEVEIQLVWYPVWSPDKMSRLAKITLGYH